MRGNIARKALKMSSFDTKCIFNAVLCISQLCLLADNDWRVTVISFFYIQDVLIDIDLISFWGFSHWNVAYIIEFERKIWNISKNSLRLIYDATYFFFKHHCYLFLHLKIEFLFLITLSMMSMTNLTEQMSLKIKKKIKCTNIMKRCTCTEPSFTVNSTAHNYQPAWG